VKIEGHVSLAQFTTLKIGGAARYFATVTTEAEVLEAIGFGRERGLPLFVLGGGSNLVVLDSGFAGLVVHLALGCSMVLAQVDGGVFHHVDAGVEWDAFVRRVCERGISGVECLAGIPGLVGGSPIQNIGAYGQEVSTTIHAVRALDLETMEFVDIPKAKCGFSYRTSIFNSTRRGRYVVTRVDFFFPAGVSPNLGYADLAPLREAKPTALDVYHFVRSVRDRKGMLIDAANSSADSRSAGSFFKNPVVSAKVFKDIVETLPADEGIVPHWPAENDKIKLAAAWLIEHSGFKKGYALGRAGISSKHTLALVNRTGDATCEELLRLRDLIVLTVEQRFGVTLVMEPVMLGQE
jgi:UDP-N-acetylmuramate dehydrogenase